MEALLDRAKWDRLPPGELVEVVAEIERARREGSPHLYTLVHILGRAFDAETHAEVVAPLVDYRDDTMVAGIALTILADWWGRGEEWLPVLRRSVAGQEWDAGDNVQLVACAVSGGYLRERSDPALLGSLLSVAESEAGKPVVAKAAREEVARALGHSQRERLGMDGGLPPWERLREAAEERIRSEGRE